MTVARVTSGNTPYTALSTDDLIIADESGGNVVIKFEAAPTTTTRHTVKWLAWTATSAPVAIQGNGKQLESADSSGTLGSSASLTQQGGAVTWEYDGTEWLVVG